MKIVLHNWFVKQHWLWTYKMYRPTPDHPCAYRYTHIFYGYSFTLSWRDEHKFNGLISTFIK